MKMEISDLVQETIEHMERPMALHDAVVECWVGNEAGNPEVQRAKRLAQVGAGESQEKVAALRLVGSTGPLSHG